MCRFKECVEAACLIGELSGTPIPGVGVCKLKSQKSTCRLMRPGDVCLPHCLQNIILAPHDSAKGCIMLYYCDCNGLRNFLCSILLLSGLESSMIADKKCATEAC